MPHLAGSAEVLRITVSGMGQLWPLTPDESVLLQDYRLVRDQGRGSLFVEFHDNRATKWEVRSGGGVQLVNQLLDGVRKLKE